MRRGGSHRPFRAATGGDIRQELTECPQHCRIAYDHDAAKMQRLDAGPKIDTEAGAHCIGDRLKRRTDAPGIRKALQRDRQSLDFRDQRGHVFIACPQGGRRDAIL